MKDGKTSDPVEKILKDVFNEWGRRYEGAPEEFAETLDSDGKLITDYGERCAVYFTKIADEIHGKEEKA